MRASAGLDALAGLAFVAESRRMRAALQPAHTKALLNVMIRRESAARWRGSPGRSATGCDQLEGMTRRPCRRGRAERVLSLRPFLERRKHPHGHSHDRQHRNDWIAGKYTVERMIEDVDLPATILRPNYFMQNDASLRDALLGQGVYPQPIGSKGISMIDARDIAEAAALFLLEREHATESLPRETVELVGPDAFTGEAVAGVWSEVLGRQIHYGADDLAAFEKRLGSFAPHGMARDMRLMMSRFQQQGDGGQA